MSTDPLRVCAVCRCVAVGVCRRVSGGPIVWVDSADSEPCIGTAGAITWTLRVDGKLFHSGLPHKVRRWTGRCLPPECAHTAVHA